MTASNDTTFRVPNLKGLALNSALAADIKRLQKEGQINVWRTFLYASALRSKYMKRDGHSGRETWDPAFKKWYKDNSLQLKLGSMSQLSKCASAGDVIAKFAELFSDSEEWMHSLPTSMNALYEVSRLIKGMTPSQIRKLVYEGGEEFGDGDDERLGIISPVATAESIRAYRQQSEAKSAAKVSRAAKSARKREFTVPVATIYVSKSFFSFDSRGDHLGSVSMEQLSERVAELRRLDPDQFDVRDRFTAIKKRYSDLRKRKHPVLKVHGSKKSAASASKRGKS